MGDTPMSLNIALGDVDTPATGDATFGLRHEQWPCGTRAGRTQLGQLCEFWMMHGPKPAAEWDSAQAATHGLAAVPSLEALADKVSWVEYRRGLGHTTDDPSWRPPRHGIALPTANSLMGSLIADENVLAVRDITMPPFSGGRRYRRPMLNTPTRTHAWLHHASYAARLLLYRNMPPPVRTPTSILTNSRCHTDSRAP